MKDKYKEFALFRLALWGYSTIVLLFLTLFTLIPTDNNSGSTTDPIAGISSLSPIAIFLVLIIFEHKKYRWNIWKVILYAYSLLLMGLFTLSVFYVATIALKAGISEASNSSFAGFLYIPVLAYFIILGYEKFV